MQISELLRLYLLERDLENNSARQILTVLSRFNLHVGRISETSDFRPDVVNSWIAAMLVEGLARRTIRGYRGRLMTLWRWAYDAGHVDEPPRRIKRISCPVLIPEGFTDDEARRLLTEAAKVKGVFKRSKVSRCLLLIALVRTVWDAGLRAGDLLRLTRVDFDADGRGVLVQKKTGWPVYFTLSRSTLAAIESTFPPERVRIFGDAISRRRLFRWVERLAIAAGVKGGTKKLRKGGASYVERDNPGGAMGYLGHRTPGLAAAYYVDPSIVGRNRPRPPELTG